MEHISLNKLFYKIGEVSRLTGVKEHVIRFWEGEFAPLRPKKNRGGQRLFKDNDIKLLLDIKKMLYEEGYTIAGARKTLSNRQLLLERRKKTEQEMVLAEVKRELKELLDMM